jgi:hypothetical protein
MQRKLRLLVVLGMLVPTLMLSGCLFNMFQTAKMVQSGDVSILVGAGVMDIGLEGDPAWTLTPQARLAFGLSDAINLGLHTGALIPLSTGDPGWMGLAGDIKFSLVDNPESISLAVGFGGGNGIHFLGWGVFGEVYLDLNVFPLFFAYQPTIPLGAETLLVYHDVAVGLDLALSDKARLLIQADTRNLGLFSYGIGFEISL